MTIDIKSQLHPMDKGYDSEKIHQYSEEIGAESIIVRKLEMSTLQEGND